MCTGNEGTMYTSLLLALIASFTRLILLAANPRLTKFAATHNVVRQHFAILYSGCHPSSPGKRKRKSVTMIS